MERMAVAQLNSASNGFQFLQVISSKPMSNGVYIVYILYKMCI